jgi:hypothetical protein
MRTTHAATRDRDNRLLSTNRRTPARSVLRSGLKTSVAVLALTGGLAGVLAAPAFGAAAPNDHGTNCHGVWLSYLATSGMAPGQLHQDFGASVQDVQATADALCDSEGR